MERKQIQIGEKTYYADLEPCVSWDMARFKERGYLTVLDDWNDFTDNFAVMMADVVAGSHQNTYIWDITVNTKSPTGKVSISESTLKGDDPTSLLRDARMGGCPKFNVFRLYQDAETETPIGFSFAGGIVNSCIIKRDFSDEYHYLRQLMKGRIIDIEETQPDELGDRYYKLIIKFPRKKYFEAVILADPEGNSPGFLEINNRTIHLK